MGIGKRMGFWLGCTALAVAPLPAQKFYPDDPLWTEPPPFPATDPQPRSLNEIWERFEARVAKPGERHPEHGVIPAQGVNTLGEVPDSGWYTNRHAKTRMSVDELVRGPGNEDPPSMASPWQVLTVKRYDIRPGMLMRDADGTIYLLRFDVPGHPEMSTGASMVASTLFYALGYWVPENYLVHFDRPKLVASPEGQDISAVGQVGQLEEEDIDLFLDYVPSDPQGQYRAVATKVPDATLIGPFEMYGTRTDDPNDVVAHEHRRDLRGLRVISAWLDYNWVRALNTMDGVVTENGVPSIRHYFVDFFAALGSGFRKPKDPREGNEPFFDWNTAVKNLLGMGIYAPEWQRASYPHTRTIGRFEYETFDPERWVPNFDVPPLANSLPDDDYWAAKKVMAFTDEDIRAIVKTAQYSDPDAEEWLARCLMERRDKIGRTYFEKLLPLDNFRVENGKLIFDDLAVKYGFRDPRQPMVSWSRFANFSRDFTPIPNTNSFTLPEEIFTAQDGSCFAAVISTGVYQESVTVYLRKESGGIQIAGIDRVWPGYRVADEPETSTSQIASRYESLDPLRRDLFDRFTRSYNESTGFEVEPEEYFRSLSISERTTFDAVTHALVHTTLTDAEGNSLGTALDLVANIERIAGQYYGRQGDEQFRVYVALREGAQDTVERSREFQRDKDNTVYHVGYPRNYRQTGEVPTMQISMSEDGRNADIDVDYRSSKFPAAMWNGHLTAANSDVRAGNNFQAHNLRWSGLVAWWQAFFGKVSEMLETETPQDLLTYEPPDRVIPLPPDRPRGAEIAEIQDAAQEFLADWLVRRDYDQAMDFVSEEALPCLLLAGEHSEASRSELRQAMKQIAELYDRRHETLSGVIARVTPWGPNVREVSHHYSDDFYLGEVSDTFAHTFLCANRTEDLEAVPAIGAPATFGTYYGTIFRFRLATAEGGALGILWKQEAGHWKVVSYDVLAQ